MLNRLSSSALKQWKSYGRFVLTCRRGTASEAQKSKKKEVENHTIDSWKRDIVFELGRDLKLEHKRYSLGKRCLADEHKIVWLVFQKWLLSQIEF